MSTVPVLLTCLFYQFVYLIEIFSENCSRHLSQLSVFVVVKQEMMHSQILGYVLTVSEFDINDCCWGSQKTFQQSLAGNFFSLE